MNLTIFTSLSWAYQLHYYICFRTHRRHPVLVGKEATLVDFVADICKVHDFHLLDYEVYSDQFRCLVSLRPDQCIAKTIQTLKANVAREFNKLWSLTPPLWARGYLARSVGRVRISAVRKYLEQQGTHHGYDSRVISPVYRYRAESPVLLTSNHACFELTHHLVLATRKRTGMFNPVIGAALVNDWLRVAATRGFAIDQISVVPDHVHAIIRIVPSLSIDECALALMNNGQDFIANNYPHLMIQSGIDQLWEAGAYAGTCGNYTSALIKKWLKSSE